MENKNTLKLFVISKQSKISKYRRIFHKYLFSHSLPAFYDTANCYFDGYCSRKYLPFQKVFKQREESTQLLSIIYGL